MFGRSKRKKIQPPSQVQPQPVSKYEGPGMYSGRLVKHYCKLCGEEIKSQDSGRSSDSCDRCYHEFVRSSSRVPPVIAEAGFGNQYTANFDCYAEYNAYIRLWRAGTLTKEQYDQKIAEYIEKLCQRQAHFDEVQRNNQAAKAEERDVAQQRLRGMYGV